LTIDSMTVIAVKMHRQLMKISITYLYILRMKTKMIIEMKIMMFAPAKHRNRYRNGGSIYLLGSSARVRRE
jgi:hypothetical protein